MSDGFLGFWFYFACRGVVFGRGWVQLCRAEYLWVRWFSMIISSVDLICLWSLMLIDCMDLLFNLFVFDVDQC